MDKELEQKFEEYKQSVAASTHKKAEFEDQLAVEFPFMRRGAGIKEQEASGRIYDLYGAWGCCVWGGWYELLRSLCAEITAAYEKAGQPVDIVIDQIKEKFGTLRFYYHPEGKDPGIHAIDFLGTASLRMRPGDSELHQEVAKIVHKWEKQSAFICERCGVPGELRKDIGWVKTLCNSCYTSTKEAFEERKSQKKELLASEEKRQAAMKEFMDDQSEDTEELNYLYDELLCNEDEDEAGEAFDGFDF